MEEFNNIGMSVDGGYELEQDEFFLQELLAQHFPGCPDPYQLLEQCAHCYRLNFNNNPQAYPTPDQRSQASGYSRTWAEVASTPMAHTTMYVDMEMTDITDITDHAETLAYPIPHNNVYDGGQYNLSQSEPQRTYAEVAQYAKRPQYEYRDNQRLHPSQYAQRCAFSRQTSDPTQIRHSQYRRHNSDVRSRPDRHTNRNFSQAPYPARYSNSLPQVQEGVSAYEQIPSAQPRNVADFVQGTAIGGHRAPPPSSLLPNNSYEEPLSPGAHSVASSSLSRRSSRRKGHAMKDPSLPHECIECQHTFPKLEDLRRHISRSHASIAERPYRCAEYQCPWAFVNPKDLRRHQRTHSADQDRHNCPYESCGKSYTRADNLTRHINRDHVGDSAYLSASRNGSEMSGSYEQRSGYFVEGDER